MTRNERLERLTETSSFISQDTGGLQEGETKVGTGYDNFVIGPAGVYANRDNPSSPGFSFEDGGCRLRVGQELRTTADFRHVVFKDGAEMFNPLGDTLASTTADPLPTIRPVLPTESHWLLNGPGKEALDVFRALGL